MAGCPDARADLDLSLRPDKLAALEKIRKAYGAKAKDSQVPCPSCKADPQKSKTCKQCNKSGWIQAPGEFAKDETPQEKARRKLSPDQAARLKALLAKVKTAPSAAAPMPRAKDGVASV